MKRYKFYFNYKSAYLSDFFLRHATFIIFLHLNLYLVTTYPISNKFFT